METSADPEPVTCRREADGLAIVTIDRPERRNALNLDVKRRLTTIVETLADDSAVRVVILTGAQGVFVAGTDVAEMAPMTPTEHTLLATDQVFTVLRRFPKILIAAVEGYALGGGCELALACDLIVAGESARLGQPEIRVGIMPGAGGTQRLLRTVGKYRAMRMVLTGEPVGAREALAMGLLSDVVPDGMALERAMDLARTIMPDAAACRPCHQGGDAARAGRSARDRPPARAQGVPAPVRYPGSEGRDERLPPEASRCVRGLLSQPALARDRATMGGLQATAYQPIRPEQPLHRY